MLVAIAVAPGAAVAHAGLVAAEPAPGSHVAEAPAVVRLVFDAPVETTFLRAFVRAPDGAVVSGPARRDPRVSRAVLIPLRGGPVGTLRVEWRVLSQDGHPTGGAFVFGVAEAPGAGAAAVSTVRDDGPAAVIARFLALAAPLGLLGLVALAAGVVGPAVRSGGIVAPTESPAAGEGFRARAAAALAGASRGWWWAWWSLVAAGAIGLALIPVVVLRGLREGPGALGDLLEHTRLGHAWWVQLACLIVTAGIALALARRWGGVPRILSGWAWGWALGVPPAVALVAVSWSGHASTGGDRTPNMVIDTLHNGATAVWLGGLLGLATLVSPAVGRLAEADRVRLAAAVVVRFSALALAAVGVLVVTGVYRALAEVELGEILDTAYGKVLVVKLALFAVLLMGGAYNRLVVHPRLERAALGLDPDDGGAVAALRVSVRAELAVAALLLVSVAVLIGLPPPG